MSSRRKHDLRAVFDAILWLTRTGCQWRNLDRQFPPWKVVHYYFSKWSRDHTLETLNDAVNRRERDLLPERQTTPSLLLVDAQSARLLPRIGQDRGTDGGKWINGRKRSILTDTRGRIRRVEVHAANVHDGVAGLDLIYPDFNGHCCAHASYWPIVPMPGSLPKP
ncbi:transposase [Lewinella sp. JB7]|uniref:transposase n=1 Tax=Lewinella sp. JB7 TaxID=2962887 RepID=UPI0035318AFF